MRLSRSLLAYLQRNSLKRNFRVRWALHRVVRAAQKNPIIRQRLLEEAVGAPDGIVLEALKDKPWRPEQPESRCLFLLFTDRIEELLAFHEGTAERLYHLRCAYEAADTELRVRIRTKIRTLRDERLLVVFEPLSGKTLHPESSPPETPALELAWTRKQYDHIVRLLRQARVGDAFVFLQRLRSTRWQPSTDQTASFYRDTAVVMDRLSRDSASTGGDIFQLHVRMISAMLTLATALDQAVDREILSTFDGISWLSRVAAGESMATSIFDRLTQSQHWLDRCSVLLIGAVNPNFWSLNRLLQGLEDRNYWIVRCAMSNLIAIPNASGPSVINKLKACSAKIGDNPIEKLVLEFALVVLGFYATDIELSSEPELRSQTDFEIESDSNNNHDN